MATESQRYKGYTICFDILPASEGKYRVEGKCGNKGTYLGFAAGEFLAISEAREAGLALGRKRVDDDIIEKSG
jgi:hypothetical protein